MDITNRPKFLSFFSAVLVAAVLFLARDLLIPLALASLFTFLLNPLVKLLGRVCLPRVAAVVAVTLLCFSTLALVAWLLGGEMGNLANELPDYRGNIRKRVESLQQLGDNPGLRRLRKLVGDIKNVSVPEAPPSADAIPPPAPAKESVAAAVLPSVPPSTPATSAAPGDDSGVMRMLNMLVPTLANVFGTASVVILFVFFMLLRLEDISQRFVRLVGYGRLTLTTKAVDEASDRISRYLLMQGTVNGLYGILLASGLYFMGLPYVVLWGALAAMFRFIPYVGPWIVAVLPISLSLAVFEGWTMPLMVIGFIVALELVTNMILEPMLYGHSVGVFDFALLVAIAFWTWLWGGVGLILATPLTVCIVVFCKYIPTLEWVDVLMGDKPPPTKPHFNYFQKHLANDESSSQAIIDSSLRKDGMDKTVDDLIIPAVALTRTEEALGKLSEEEAAQMYASMRSAFTLLDETAQSLEEKDKSEEKTDAKTEAEDAMAGPEVKIFGRALQGEADALALEIMAALAPAPVTLEISAEPLLIGELVQRLQEAKPAALCISALPPRSQFAARILCRRLRSRMPDLKILLCRWTVPEEDNDPAPLLSAGATWVVSTVKEACAILEGLAEKPDQSRH